MEVNRHRLAARISTTLRAKQFLVFYTILLLGIDFAVPLLAVWFYDPRTFSHVYAESASPFAVFVDAPGALSIGIVMGGLLLIAWLRCGYIRSIVGRTSFAPANALQFISMFGVLLITDLMLLAVDMLARVAGESVWAAPLVGCLQLAGYLVLLYADYAVVISEVDPVTALRRSVDTVRTNLITSLLILLAVSVLSMVVAGLIDPEISGTLPDSLGWLVVRVVILGVVSFIADVTLIAVYADSSERGVSKPNKQNG